MSNLNIFEIPSDDDGMRLDRWLRKKFGRVPQAQVEKLSRTGQIRLDGRRVKASTRLERGQVIKVPSFEIDTKKLSGKKQYYHNPQDLNLIKDAEIYRDDDIIVINKPPGIPVQGGSKVRRHIDGLMEALCKPGEARPKLVHRLDRETSGVLVLARNSFSARELARAFREREVEKTYWAIVLGKPKKREALLLNPAISKAHETTTNFEKVEVEKRYSNAKFLILENENKVSLSHFVLISSNGEMSWLQLTPITGRKHQLRKQLASIGCPILGDSKYNHKSKGDLIFAHEFNQEPDLKNLQLHARRLQFDHPFSGIEIDIEATPPIHMSKKLKEFPKGRR